MPGLKWFVLLPSAACFASFSWGTVRHFHSAGPVPRGMRHLEAISIVAMSVFAWIALVQPLSRLWPAAPVLCLASWALFFWAVRTTRGAGLALAFSGAHPPAVLMSGPYRYVRHPFYTSYLVFWFSTCIATTSGLPWIGLLLLVICYVIAAREEEKVMSRGRLGADYADYASRTGMFLPWFEKRMLKPWSRDIET